MIVATALKTARFGAARVVQRNFHTTMKRSSVTEFKFPAMSPTMTEGSIGEWKVEEGKPFQAGDVIMTIETDKATVDVEAQDDGILAKIGMAAGTAGIPVGQTIALLAEEGDDLSNLEFPPPSSSTSAEEPVQEQQQQASTPSSDSPTPSPLTPTTHASSTHAHPTHPHPLLPSVLRQLTLAGITDTSSIKATGFKGTLTKGDVLAYLGKIDNAFGSLKQNKVEKGQEKRHPAQELAASPKDTKPQVSVQLDGPTIRRMIATGLSIKATTPSQSSNLAGEKSTSPVITFDDILGDYLPPTTKPTSTSTSTTPSSSSTSTSSFVPPAKNDFDSFLDL